MTGRLTPQFSPPAFVGGTGSGDFNVRFRISHFPRWLNPRLRCRHDRAEVAESISKSLAKKAVAIALDGTLRDLSDPVVEGKIEIVTRTDPRALELIRHDAAHVMAEAVQELWPGTQVTIGPVIENGFYYDFAKDEPFTPDDLPKIEKKMKEIIQRNKPFTKEVWSRDKAKEVFASKGEKYKVELVDAIRKIRI